MSIVHLPLLDDEKWYVITVNHGEEKGRPFWRGGRVVLHGPRSQASIEWSLLTRGFGVGFEIGRNGGESDVGLSLYFGSLGSVWLRLRAPWTHWLRVSQDPEWYYARNTGIRLFSREGCYLQVNFGERDGVWSKGQPWYRSWSITTSTLFGKTKTDQTYTAGGMCQVPLPEGIYQGAWSEKSYVFHYQRPLGKLRDRILGPRRNKSIWLDIAGGIPHQGKGENSYDCGMDGLFGIGGKTLEEAIGHAVESTLRYRKRYGGPHNLPRAMTVTEAEALQGS